LILLIDVVSYLVTLAIQTDPPIQVTISMDSRIASISSANIWAREVMIPCPISILLVKQVILPSSPIHKIPIT
jgi:hypothetical protein